MATQIKPGDFIYYVSKKNGGHFPTKAYRVTKNGNLILIDNPRPNALPILILVSADNCVLQSEWLQTNTPREITRGSVVTYREPMADEVGLTFTVIDIEPETDWCMLRANVDMNIQPTQTANISELKLV